MHVIASPKARGMDVTHMGCGHITDVTRRVAALAATGGTAQQMRARVLAWHECTHMEVVAVMVRVALAVVWGGGTDASRGARGNGYSDCADAHT